MTIYSTKAQLEQVAEYLSAYMRIPYFQDDTIPGKVMEKIVSLVHSGRQLGTYDYVDVCKEGSVGWQVKSTKESTPLTWKRAKIANADHLVKKSKKGGDYLQHLGDAIIDFCNSHAHKSIESHNLKEIGYARLIMFDDGTAVYFERLVCTREHPDIFNKGDYTWRWSRQKRTAKKEQLPALHGTCVETGEKAFAWHGLGENQLHFSGEKDWWPAITRPRKQGVFAYSEDGHAIAFKLPSSKVSWDDLRRFLNVAS